MAPIDARSVANYLLSKADVDQRPLDQLRLQKLTFLAHGWHLGLTDEPLIAQAVVAWPYGPVIPELYHAFKRYGSGRITGRASYYTPGVGWEPFPTAMDPFSKQVVDAVWKNYSPMTGGQLITLTHEPGTPWAKVTSGLRPDDIRDLPIPTDDIRDYYRQLAQNNRAARAAVSG